MTGFFVFGLVIAAVIIVVFLYPTILYAAYGQCWANTYTNLDEVKSTLSYLTANQFKTAKITMGDCVGGVIFFQKGYFDSSNTDFGKFVSQAEKDYCTTTFSGYKSFILILPWKTVKDQAQSDAGWLSKIKQKWEYYYGYAKRLWSSTGREALIKPSCIGIEGNFADKNGNTVIYLPSNLEAGPQNLNEKELSFCYKFTKVPATDGFTYRMELAADSECQDMTKK